MSFAVFEILCIVIVATTLAVMARARGRERTRALVIEYLQLAVAAWVGEETCVRFYRFYAYADGWHVHVDRVPILVPMIWPLVVMSAADVARVLVPAARPWKHALIGGALVAFDASLVEVIAVRAGLWSWSEGGHLGVPVIGIFGWGYFAIGALAPERRSLAIVTGPIAAHALILASWWALFRWSLRGELHLVGFGLVGLASLGFTFVAARARARGRAMPPALWAPRVIAALLFVVLLATTAPRDVALWAHAAAVAVPYLALTSLEVS